ncbi:MAG: BRO family protein, partial [Pseudomonas sp.]
NWASEGVGATAAALVDLSTVAGNKISNPPWVKFQSAGWVNFPSAPTSGLYKLVVRSKKPEARAFQDWVTRVILPAIRKDGAYVLGEEIITTGTSTP